jgi:hypothetical protein
MRVKSFFDRVKWQFLKLSRFFLNGKSFLKLNAIIRLGYSKFDLNHPKTYNEKVNRFKLDYMSDPKQSIAICANKFLVKDYIEENLKSKDYTASVISSSENLLDLNFSVLKDGMYIKSSSGSGDLSVIQYNKNSNDLKVLIDNFSKGKLSSYGKKTFEYWYDNTTPVYFFEENVDKNDDMVEFKVYCFNSNSEKFRYVIRVINGRKSKKKNLFYNEKWEPLYIGYNLNKFMKPIPKPLYFEKLLNLSKRLSMGFNHVRIDFMIVDSRIFVGELTFADTNGFVKFNHKAWDEYLGNLWVYDYEYNKN